MFATIYVCMVLMQSTVGMGGWHVCVDVSLFPYMCIYMQLRAYMSARSNEGIDESLVGNIAFYNSSEDDFFLLVGDTDLGQTPLLLTISGTLLILCAAFGVPMAIYAVYDIDINKLVESQSSIKSFIRGFVLVLCFAVPAAVGYDMYNVRSLGGIIQSKWIKYFTVSGGSAVIVYGFIAGFVIVYLNRKVWMITNNTVVSVIIQALGIGLTVAFSELMAFHGLFIVFFLLLTSSPQHITVSIVFYGAGFFSCVVITALFLVSLINRYNNHLKLASSTQWSANRLKCYTCLTTSYLIFFFTLVYSFLAAFVYSFTEFISFANSGDGSSYIATLTPSLLLTVLGIFLTFILKKQTSLHEGIAKKDSQDNTKSSAKSEDPNSKMHCDKAMNASQADSEMP